MIMQCAWQQELSFFGDKPIIVQLVDADLSSDAGLLPIRQLDETLRLTAAFAAALLDERDEPAVQHSYLEMTRSRVYGILAGYEDQNDHDTLRSDPVFKLIANRVPDDDDLASQPTLSRFENAIGPSSLFRLQDVLIDQFIASFADPPTHLTFDIDAIDDPTHGDQQLTFFHGYYDQYQYLERVITCAENDHIVMATLLFGTAPASLGADDDLSYLVQRLRRVWPWLRISLRGDCGFAVPEFYITAETQDVDYSIGLGMNPVLQRLSEPLLKQAIAQWEATGQPQRLFDAFWYRAESWPVPRWVVMKAEANAAGTNRRAVVTNRPGARVLPDAAYDEYGERGESENRNKELKRSLRGDRLSDHRFMANYFRLYMHCLAANLLVRVRRVVAQPPAPLPSSVEAEAKRMEPPQPEPACEEQTAAAAAPCAACMTASAASSGPLPASQLAGAERKRYFNHRRQQDPLGEGHAETWRTRLIKVAAQIVVSSRRVLVQLSSSWPHLDHYRAVCEAVQRVSGTSLDTG